MREKMFFVHLNLYCSCMVAVDVCHRPRTTITTHYNPIVNHELTHEPINHTYQIRGLLWSRSKGEEKSFEAQRSMSTAVQEVEESVGDAAA